ncbi:putative uncharacterized protein [Meiothermus ruber H328]|nr:putative uncharacterized protein [Meiothermus ruber H328]
MRVGVLNSWLSSRYLPFWESYLQALEVEVVQPEEASVNLPVPAPIRRVLGQVFSLKTQGVDYLLLPDVQLGVEPHRGSPSPWLVDLQATLERLVPGLPPALVVPAERSPEVAGLAAPPPPPPPQNWAASDPEPHAGPAGSGTHQTSTRLHLYPSQTVWNPPDWPGGPAHAAG